MMKPKALIFVFILSAFSAATSSEIRILNMSGKHTNFEEGTTVEKVMQAMEVPQAHGRLLDPEGLSIRSGPLLSQEYTLIISPPPRLLERVGNSIEVHQGGYDRIVLAGNQQTITFTDTSHDKTKILGVSSNTVQIWDVDSAQRIGTLIASELIRTATFSPDGRLILTTSYENVSPQVWDVDTKACIKSLIGHTNIVGNGMFSPEGCKALTYSWDHSVKLWDLESGGCIATLSEESPVVGLFSPCAEHVLVMTRDSGKLYNIKTNDFTEAWQNFHPHCGWLGSTVLTANGKQVLIRDGSAVKIWSIADNNWIQTFDHLSQVDSFMFSPDGNNVFTTDSRTIKIWSIQSGNCLHTFPLAEETGSGMTNFSSDGIFILTKEGVPPNTAVIREVQSGEEVIRHPINDGQISFI